MSILLRRTEIAHPEWLNASLRSLENVILLHQRQLLPKSIKPFMIVTPIRHTLRCIYGSNWKAVWALAILATSGTWNGLQGAFWRLWHYSILRQDPAEQLQRMLEEVDAQTSRDRQ